MFGYLRPIKSVEHENYLFKAHYCSLCKAIGKEYGNGFRVMLSYDVAFMNFFLGALSGRKIETEYENCLVHPFRKRLVKKRDHTDFECAKATALLFSMKVSDDLNDEKGLKRFLTGSFRILYENVLKKAVSDKRYDYVLEYMKLNNELEMGKCSDADLISNAFGNFLMKLVESVAVPSCIILEDGHKELIFLIGKWIYLIDALDDLESDYDDRKYNVFKFAYSGDFLDEKSIGSVLKDIYDRERWRMSLLLDHIRSTYFSVRNSLKYYSVEFDDIIFGSLVKITNAKLSLRKKHGRSTDEPLQSTGN